MLGTSLVGREIWEVDLGLVRRRQFLLSLLSCLPHTLKSQFVGGNVHVVLVLELFH